MVSLVFSTKQAQPLEGGFTLGSHFRRVSQKGEGAPFDRVSSSPSSPPLPTLVSARHTALALTPSSSSKSLSYFGVFIASWKRRIRQPLSEAFSREKQPSRKRGSAVASRKTSCRRPLFHWDLHSITPSSASAGEASSNDFFIYAKPDADALMGFLVGGASSIMQHTRDQL